MDHDCNGAALVNSVLILCSTLENARARSLNVIDDFSDEYQTAFDGILPDFPFLVVGPEPFHKLLLSVLALTNCDYIT